MEASKLIDRDKMKRINELKQNEFKKNRKRTFLKENDSFLLKPKCLLFEKINLIPKFS